ncbi:MAG: hypothetical protein JNM84_11060 [Planctomycetes bacterium]|nr:hypothetical protein [Planctomycetota bacterium]
MDERKRTTRRGKTSEPQQRVEQEVLDLLVKVNLCELRAIGHRLLRAERADHSWQTTELVSEAYAKLRASMPPHALVEKYFLGIVKRAMYQALSDHARHRNAKKRQPGGERVLLETVLADRDADPELVAQAFEAYQEVAPLFTQQQRDVFEQHFLFLAPLEDIAGALHVDLDEVAKIWAASRVAVEHFLRMRP